MPSTTTVADLLVTQIPDPPMPVGDQGPQYMATETYSEHILGSSSFKMYYLYARGLAGNPPFPWEVKPGQSPYIIGENEPLELGVIVSFDRSPLTQLLMCLGTDINISFAFEGFGKGAVETEVDVKVTSIEGQFKYLIRYTGTPKQIGLTPGYYELAATATIGPMTHRCGQLIFGYGYIGEVRFQVYEGPLP